MGSKVNSTPISRGLHGFLEGTYDIFNKNGDMVIICNGNNNMEIRCRNNWGRIFFKVDTFYMGSTVGIILGEVTVNVLGNTLYIRR